MHKSPGRRVARTSAPDRRPIGTLPVAGLVPFIASWSSESAAQPEVTMRRGRLAYLKERPYDRDSNGILWRRVPSTPGKGKPQYGKVHFARQRYTAVRVRRYALSGVHGVLYRPGFPRPVPHDVGGMDFGDDRMPWMQAAQLMMRLDDFRPVDLETEYGACGVGRWTPTDQDGVPSET
ncbi:hypothetical protein AB0399_27635 [Streptomyces sp. NPDC088194]|uniref:hypothetical protein n=1 Tax=Streptomyces sp. NPDC088194 TaxID=3154931 RepID=UPI0034501378